MVVVKPLNLETAVEVEAKVYGKNFTLITKKSLEPGKTTKTCNSFNFLETKNILYIVIKTLNQIKLLSM